MQITNADLTAPISLSGFEGTSLSTFACGSYQLSGQYGVGDYLQKTYATSLAHYQLVVRFNIAFMGPWSSADQLIVTVDGNSYYFNYTCTPDVMAPLCTSNDCVRIREVNQSHGGPTALVRFASTSTDPKTTKSWGLKDLLIVQRTCHSRCGSCFGPTINDCYTCAAGFFLLGNACLDACPLLNIPSLNLCAVSCPNSYYAVKASSSCEPCSDGCSVCSGPLEADCVVDNQAQSSWERKKEFWILLIVVCVVALVLGVACLIHKRRADKVESLSEPMIKNSLQTENSLDNPHVKLNANSLNDFGYDEKLRTVKRIEEVSVSNSDNSDSSSSTEDKKKRKWRGNEEL